jgi:hypothetical protein
MLDQQNYSIEIHNDKPIQEDYKALKELGLSYIQEYSKAVWTDFNAGDPGLTTLELLCYALTDLSYRTQLPLGDLLTTNDAISPFNKTNSFKAEDILTHNPLTIQDYRKLILDKHPEIRNIWFYPIKKSVSPEIYIHKNKEALCFDITSAHANSNIVLKGLYNVKVETIERSEDIIAKIYKTLHEHRNLCEDFHCIDAVEFEYVTICMDVDLDGTVKPEKIKEEIYRLLYLYCAPHLRRYSLREMLAKGYGIEEIFEGPKLENGFFDDEELAEIDKKDKLYVSDLINMFMDIKGIENIRKIHLNSYGATNDDIDLNIELYKDQEYCIHLSDIFKAFRFFLDRPNKKANKINFYYDDLKLHEPELIAEDKLIPKKQTLPSIAEEWEHEVSQYRNLKPYYSIQNEFPKAYLLGQEGISGLESEERKVQRLQFKGYLLLFEQMMANYLAQLNHVKNLLSWNSDADYRSYMYQALSPDEIKDLDLIITDRYHQLFDNITNDKANDDFHEQVLNISSEENFDRRNRFLNYLIARFNDSFVEFSIVEFFKKNNKTYGKHSIIADKKSFLRTYPKYSANRLKAMNYTKPIWNTTNISGYEMRVSKKLGLTNYLTSNPDLVFRHSNAHPVLSLVNLSDPLIDTFYNYNTENFDKQFGFHVVEHLLLRPRSKSDIILPICNEYDEDILSCSCNDPYSFRLTVVLPGWLPITLNEGFREYVERVFREELPAHLSVKLCWVGPDQMLNFERCFFNYCKYLEQSKGLDCTEKMNSTNQVLSDLIATLSGLSNVYYPSHLVDCQDIDFDYLTNEVSKHPSILGKTKLNSKLTFGVNCVKPVPKIYERFGNFENTIDYEETENSFKFFLKDRQIKIEESQTFILKKSSRKGTDGKITLANGRFLSAYVSDEEVITSFKFINLNSQEMDSVWLQYKDDRIFLNLNQQLEFEISLNTILIAEDGYHFKIKHANEDERMVKIDQITLKPDLKQHELEKIWLEKQFDSSYTLPAAQDINFAEFLTVFMQKVNNRNNKKNNL